MSYRYTETNKLFSHETSINAGFTKDPKNLVCEFHVTFKKQLFTHETLIARYSGSSGNEYARSTSSDARCA